PENRAAILQEPSRATTPSATPGPPGPTNILKERHDASAADAGGHGGLPGTGGAGPELHENAADHLPLIEAFRRQDPEVGRLLAEHLLEYADRSG
ncbi:hypothetical protein AB0F71_29440, partial [Kitasatospora sp. NPDC028055]